MRLLSIMILLGLLLPGCGPFAVGAGLSELFKDDTVDPVNPQILELYVHPPGENQPRIPAPKYASVGSIEFEIVINKPRANVFMSLDGPFDEEELCTATQVEQGDTLNCVVADNFVPVGRTTDASLRFSVGTALAQAEPAAGLLDDGKYFLTVTIRDAEGREDEVVHDFIVDKLAPDKPVLLGVEANAPTSIDVRWTPSADRMSEDNDDADPSGVIGYRIYWHEGGIEVPSTGPDESEDPDHRFVPGGATSEFRVTDLCAGRLHRVWVVAIDAAGQVGQTVAFRESAASNKLDVRTRVGGEGKFHKPAFQNVVRGARVVRVADLNGDGVEDLVVVSPDEINVLLGEMVEEDGVARQRFGSGTFKLHQRIMQPQAGDEFNDALVRDMNNDNIPDLVVVRKGTSGGATRVYIGTEDATAKHRGTGRFVLSTTIFQNEFSGSPRGIVGSSPEPGVRAHFFSPTSGSAFEFGEYDVPETKSFGLEVPFFANAGCAAMLDHNNDGVDDLSLCIGSDLLSVLAPTFPGAAGAVEEKTTGTKGLFLRQSAFRAVASAGGNGVAMVSGQFNEDPYPDLVIAHDSGTLALVLSSGPLADPTEGDVGEGDVGSQTGLPQFEAPKIVTLGTGALALATGDFDSDGITDIAVADADAGTVTILFGNSSAAGLADGTFRLGSPIDVGPQLRAVSTGDFNSDGVTDLVLVGEDPTPGSELSRLYVVIGKGVTARGDGGFADPISLGVPGQGGLFLEGAQDVTRDGIDDLYGIRSGFLRVLHGRGASGQGNGRFDFGRSNFWHTGAQRLAAADLDGDGLVDFIQSGGTTSANGTLETHQTTGGGFLRTFGGVPDAPPGSQACTGVHSTPAPIPADFDGDGNLDVLLVRGGIDAIVHGKPRTGLTQLPGPSAGGTAPSLVKGGFAVQDSVASFYAGPCVDALAIGRFESGSAPGIVAVEFWRGRIQLLTERRLGFASEFAVGDSSDSKIAVNGGATSEPIAAIGLPFSTLVWTFEVGDVDDGGEILVYLVPVAREFPDTLYINASTKAGIAVTGPTTYPAPPEEDDELTADAAEVAEAGGVVELEPIELSNTDDGKTLIRDVAVPNNLKDFALLVVNHSGAPLRTESLKLRRIPDFTKAGDFEIPEFRNPNGAGIAPLAAETKLNALIAADLNHDGRSDVVALHPVTKNLAVVLIDRDTEVPNLDGEVTIHDLAELVSGTPISIRLTDLNADGVLDLIGLASDPAELFIALGEISGGRAQGSFDFANARVMPLPGIGSVNSLVVGDFNSDRIPDLAIGTDGDPRLLFGSGKLTAEEDDS